MFFCLFLVLNFLVCFVELSFVRSGVGVFGGGCCLGEVRLVFVSVDFGSGVCVVKVVWGVGDGVLFRS